MSFSVVPSLSVRLISRKYTKLDYHKDYNILNIFLSFLTSIYVNVLTTLISSLITYYSIELGVWGFTNKTDLFLLT